MPIDHDSMPSDVSIHSHSGDCKEELSGKYAEYINEHRTALLTKCERVNDCIEGLLEDENILMLLKGDNLSLNKTCSLIYEYGFDKNAQSGKCTSDDRKDIRDDLEQHLLLKFEDAKASGWRNVKKCLINNYGTHESSTYVNDLCKLAQSKSPICESRNIHKNVTTFFNNQIQHLQCTCRNLQKGDHTEGGRSLPLLVGGILGGLLLLIVIAVVIFIYFRRRKSRKSKKQAPNVIYLPAPTGDNCPVYQELCDDPNYQDFAKYHSGKPPALPMRYGKLQTGQEDENAYMEPVEAGLRFKPKVPFPGQMNPHYGAPPEYSERATEDVGNARTENEYFPPLSSLPNENGFDNANHGPENSFGYETFESVLSDAPTGEAPNPEGATSAPIPAKRSRINHEEASRYDSLEVQGNKNVDSTV